MFLRELKAKIKNYSGNTSMFSDKIHYLVKIGKLVEGKHYVVNVYGNRVYFDNAIKVVECWLEKKVKK
jgi:hypothetical protein